MKWQYKTTTPEATRHLGEKLGHIFKPLSGIVYLTGDLGAGKTAITQGIVKGMGITAQVTSPTFALVNEYGNKSIKVVHMDLYRLLDFDELEEIGFDDFLRDGSIILVEWPDLLIENRYEPLAALSLSRVEGEDDSRIINLKTEDASLIERVKQLG
jgi:tRNA threonylcarbamoyladenosine biosynthesis protein TsaE